MFIVFEGIDGAGKTTQARKLHERLAAENARVELVADPGTTTLGKTIRKILLESDAPLAKSAQLLLFSAARAELAEYIQERLADNFTVICDRWLLSTLVYQGEIGGHCPDFIREVYRKTSVSLLPDCCFFMDLPSHMSAGRTGPGRDRYERVDEETRARMAAAYHRFSVLPDICKQLVYFDATQPLDEIHAQVYAAYQGRLNSLSFSSPVAAV